MPVIIIPEGFFKKKTELQKMLEKRMAKPERSPLEVIPYVA